MIVSSTVETADTPTNSVAPYAGSRSAPLNPHELEALAFNLQTAVRVHSECQFFSWTQGVLQSLVSHELLLCLTAAGENDFNRVAALSTATPDGNIFERLCRHEGPTVRKLIAKWRENHYEAVVIRVSEEPLANTQLAQELTRIEATAVLAHGVCAPDGNMASFYLFAGREDELGARQAYLAELIVPFLHAAWTRSNINPPREAGKNGASDRIPLTAREQEVLKWIYLGKSNIEIGLILGISPLTVKNHVQEILRRLNVLNRAQAVGKALSLRLISV